MNCIGSKCSFCHQHDFQESYFYCELDDVGFKKDNFQKHKCDLDFEFSIIKEKYEKMLKVIQENQNI